MVSSKFLKQREREGKVLRRRPFKHRRRVWDFEVVAERPKYSFGVGKKIISIDEKR
ncbi:MAG: hypothetical protein Q9180_006541, partial [Flavoplaca navasiana]